jgi:hypothetical protein
VIVEVGTARCAVRGRRSAASLPAQPLGACANRVHVAGCDNLDVLASALD